MSEQGVIRGQINVRFGIHALSSLPLEKRKEEGKLTNICAWPHNAGHTGSGECPYLSCLAHFPVEETEAQRDEGICLLAPMWWCWDYKFWSPEFQTRVLSTYTRMMAY